MATIHIVDIEAVSTRYTGQWREHVPELLKQTGHVIKVIAGPTDIPDATTPGAFLNFGGTNIYKASQVEQIGRLFCAGEVKSGDHFLFTDAWHPGIINLKYMSELLNIPVKIHALWHAGSYDPHDFLGRLIGDAPWVRHTEKAFFHAIDHNYFATDFHIKLFFENLFDEGDKGSRYPKVIRTGWPMEYMEEMLAPYRGRAKRNMILFPHRVAPEKQLPIFEDLRQSLPEYEFVVCQDRIRTKDEYHTLLGEAKLVFSANLQETLGISWYEGALVGAIPMVPDRLSYSEMGMPEFKYPSEWTESFEAYTANKAKVIERIRWYMENYDAYTELVKIQVSLLKKDFFGAGNLLRMF